MLATVPSEMNRLLIALLVFLIAEPSMASVAVAKSIATARMISEPATNILASSMAATGAAASALLHTTAHSHPDTDIPSYDHLGCSNTVIAFSILFTSAFLMLLMLLRLVNLAIKEYLLPDQYRRYQCAVSNLLKKYEVEHSPTIRRCIDTVLEDLHQFDESLAAGERGLQPTVMTLLTAMGVALLVLFSMPVLSLERLLDCMPIEQIGMMFAALSFAGVVSGIIFGGALDVVYAIVGIGLIAAAGFLLYSASKKPVVLTVSLTLSSILMYLTVMPLLLSWIHASNTPPPQYNLDPSKASSGSTVVTSAGSGSSDIGTLMGASAGPSISGAKLLFIFLVLIVFFGTLVLIFRNKSELVVPKPVL